MSTKKKPARNATIVYPQPVPTKQFAESVIIRKWHAWAGYWFPDRQITEYQGTRKDLIAVGIAPEQIFMDVGKCGQKTARILTDDGDERRIEVKRLANDRWNVKRSHALGSIPYTSSIATCTKENGSIDDYGKKQRQEEVRNTPATWDAIEGMAYNQPGLGLIH